MLHAQRSQEHALSAKMDFMVRLVLTHVTWTLVKVSHVIRPLESAIAVFQEDGVLAVNMIVTRTVQNVIATLERVKFVT